MVGLLNGSPKAPGGVSGAMLKQLLNELGESAVLYASENGSEDAYAQLNGCKTVILVFPVYADALPSHLLRFLTGWQEYRKHRKNPECRIYAVSHAGFYDSAQCRWSLDILRNFCFRSELLWCGGAGIGGGFIFSEPGVPDIALKPMRDTLSMLAQAAKQGQVLSENCFVSPGMPRWLYMMMANKGWKAGAKQNGLPPKNLRYRE